jgi:thiol-disulfide isomerase/thioredoxin
MPAALSAPIGVPGTRRLRDSYGVILMSVSKNRLPGIIALAALALLGAWAAPAAVRNRMTGAQIQDYNAASTDTARAAWAMQELRKFLADDPDTTHGVLARRMIVRAMFTLKAPPAQIIALIDSTGRMLPSEPQIVIFYYAQLAQDIMDRGMDPQKGLEYAHRAVDALPRDQQYAPLHGMVHGILGRAQLVYPKPDSAIASLKIGVQFSPDSQRVLAYLGQAYEKAKKPDLAIDTYIRSLSIYGSRDTTAAAPLRAAWKKKNGSLAGLDQRLAAARGVSRKRVALDAQKFVAPAPGWSLTYLDKTPVSWDQFKGKVVVLDFWGSWCGPCRMELPVFQSVYERYKDKGVVFLGMNFERPVPGKELRDVTREFMERNKYTFPVVIDHDQVATGAYNVSGFPTMYMIDKSGNIRYRNVGVLEGIETIMQDQIESLLD